MHFNIPHQFSKAQAVDRIKKALVEARPHMQGQVVMEKEEWDGDTFNFAFLVQKQRITGSVLVEDAQFVVDAKLPLLWRMFEGKIQRTIEEQVKTLQK